MNLGLSPRAPLPLPPIRRQGLASFYEAHAVETLRTLWRRKYLLAGFALVGLLTALLLLVTSTRIYTATAVIQFDFGRMEAVGPPSAAMDAGSLVEGQAQMLRSRALARRVVAKLKLDENPAYISSGFVGRTLNSLLQRKSTPTSNIDTAAQRLQGQLEISNNPRSYLIYVTIKSTSPEQAAILANAYLSEYVNDKVMQRLRETEATARSALADARAAFGERHPKVIQAKGALASAEARLRDQEKSSTEHTEILPRVPGQSFLKAEPEWIPAGPNPIAMIALGLAIATLAGVGLVLFQERRDTGFRTEDGVPAELGVRCAGMIPRASDKFSADRKLERREALRSLCLSIGLTGRGTDRAGARVVMVSSALPNSGAADFANELRRSLVEEGSRVLVVDASPSSHAGNAIGLDDALESSERLEEFFADESGNSASELRRKAGLNGARNPFASFAYAGRSFERLLTAAKEHYDVVIVTAPPVLLLTDSVFLGRFADICLLVAGWNKTPKATVAEAVHRLTENGVQVDGVVLTEVDLGRYASFATGDRMYYLSRYKEAFRSPPKSARRMENRLGE
ncbi:Wzz/FepE/Etk N-terminal domain-containing protein [Hyphomicrobium sp.]|uniref:Wzz/FepE/Etk N-terminal domain-containing protein n=1 Tax=Hyphomicrobium sp. TaxID=82 RepID=UPI0025C56035|nr:Wzz/FepE/Etk N-terminal domain-containing protein [Hyphomicrobium sp.]MCC7250777.1 hypothetical protein [Hyphomicrobium sp.]